MGLSGDFLNALNNPHFNEEEALKALQNEVSGKKRPKLSLSQRASAQLSSSSHPVEASQTSSVNPIKALKDVRGWLQNPTTRTEELSAEGIQNLRKLCTSQETKASCQKPSIFARFYSNGANESKKTNQVLACKRCEILLKKRNLNEAEQKELCDLLNKNVLENYSKTASKTLIRSFTNTTYIKHLLDSSDTQEIKAFNNLLKHAYGSGQLYHLFKEIDLDPLQQTKIQAQLESAMNISIDRSIKKNFLIRFFADAPPTLRIPLDPTREALCMLNPARATTLDNILGAACFTVIFCNRLHYTPTEDAKAKYTLILGKMITCSAHNECKIQLAESSFKNPSLASQIATQNTKLKSDLQHVYERSNPSFQNTPAVQDLAELIRLTPLVSQDAQEACMNRNHALTYDVLGLMNAVIKPKSQEAAIASTAWNVEREYCQKVERSPTLSSEAKRQLQTSLKLLAQSPSLERYTMLQASNDGLRAILTKSYPAAMYSSGLSQSAPVASSTGVASLEGTKFIMSTKSFFNLLDFYFLIVKNNIQKSLPQELENKKYDILFGKLTVEELEKLIGKEHLFVTLYQEYLLLKEAKTKYELVQKQPSNFTVAIQEFFTTLPSKLSHLNSGYKSIENRQQMMLDMIQDCFKAHVQQTTAAEKRLNKFMELFEQMTVANQPVLDFFNDPAKDSKEKLLKINALIHREIERTGKKGADLRRECVVAFVLSIPENQQKAFIESFFSLPEPRRDDDEIITIWGHIREAICYSCYQK